MFFVLDVIECLFFFIFELVVFRLEIVWKYIIYMEM